MAEILETVLYYYQWQNALEQAQAWAQHAGFEVAEHMAVERDTIVLQLKPLPGVDKNGARQKLRDAMNQDGITIVFTEEVSEPVPVERPWWESLPGPDAQGNKVRIFAAEQAQVYQTGAFEVYPAEGNEAQFARHSDGSLRILAVNEGADVWARPAFGSAWICVYRSPTRNLWVLGRQMKSVG